jgi:putative ABC transport system permease protein
VSVAKIVRVTWPGLVLRNLLRRPARSALTAVGVAVGVGLIVALLSITAGVRRTADDLIHVGRADFGLFQSGVIDFTRSLLPESLASQVAKDPDVKETARIKLVVTSVPGSDSFLLFGLAPGEFAAQRLVVVAGRRAEPRQALLGDAAARRLHLRPGDSLQIAGRRFRLAGVYHSGDRFEDSGAVVDLRVAERLSRHPGEVTTIGVLLRGGADPRTVAQRLERRFPGLTTITEPGQAVRVDTSSRLIVETGWIISLLALIVGGIAVTNTMAMSVFERVREIGILRAVGWPAWRIGLLVVSEAVTLCLAALGVGLGVGFLAAEAFTDRASLGSLVQPRFTAGVFAWGLAFALGVALIGAAYPTWRATRLRPVAALRRE